MARFSIKAKLITSLSVILLVVMVAVGMINYQVSRDSIRQELLTSSLPLTRDNIYSELNHALMRPVYVASLMANDSFLKEWVKGGEQGLDRISRYLNDIRKKYGYFTAFFVSNKTKKYYYHKGVLKHISRMDLHDIWYYEFLGRDLESDLDVDTNEAADNELTVFMNFRVEDEQGFLMGVTGVGLHLNTVTSLIKEFQEKYHRRIYLVDSFGTVQAHSDLSKIEKVSLHDMPGISAVADDILALKKAPGRFEYDDGGHHVLLAARYIPEIDWYLVVEQDEQSSLQTARNNFMRTVAAGALAWVLIVLIISWTVNYFQSRLVFQAATDSLTGVANRREFESRFLRAVARFNRHNEVFSLILLDLDGFKLVNDLQGHVEGDRVLRDVAKCLESLVRPADLVARWGGDEFIVLLRGGKSEAEAMASRIRQSVADARFGCRSGSVVAVTASCGVAEYQQDEELDDLVRRADKAVYEAKTLGRNRVVSA